MFFTPQLGPLSHSASYWDRQVCLHYQETKQLSSSGRSVLRLRTASHKTLLLTDTEGQWPGMCAFSLWPLQVYFGFCFVAVQTLFLWTLPLHLFEVSQEPRGKNNILRRLCVWGWFLCRCLTSPGCVLTLRSLKPGVGILWQPSTVWCWSRPPVKPVCGKTVSLLTTQIGSSSEGSITQVA